MSKVWVGALGTMLVAGILTVIPVSTVAAAGASTAKPPPAPLPSGPPTTAGLHGPVGDFANPPLLDPTTGTRVGLAAKPDETPKGATLVAQTATSDTYALGNGKFVLRARSRPVNWQDSNGLFHRLDLTLTKGADGRWRPKSAPPGASFVETEPAGGSGVAGGHTVQVDGPGWSVGFDPTGAPALSASVTSADASYSLGGGISLVEQAAPDGGVKEAIRLQTAPGGPADVSYVFALDLKGVAPSVESNGLIVFTSPDGTVVASVPAGLAVDSTTPAPAQSPATMALVGGPGSWALKVTTSGSWLADKARVYPVAIDPSLQFGRGGSTSEQDAFVYNGTPTINYSGSGQYVPALANYVDAVGSQSGSLWSTFLKWNLTSLIGTGKGISSATLTMSSLGSNPSAGTSYGANALAADFSASTVTWNNQPATTGVGETLSAAATGAAGTATLTNEVTQWVGGQLPTFNGWADMVIKAGGFVSGSTDFGAMSASGGVDPLLQITYTDLPPATITSPPSYLPCKHPDHSLNPLCYPVVGTTSPTITLSQSGNPAGHTVSYWYQITDGKNLSSNSGNGGSGNGDYGDIVQSGWVPSLSWTPPAGSLVDGVNYTLYVYTMVDGVSDPPNIGGFDVRLPNPAVTPSDTVGSISVNQATGSPSLSLASRSFDAAGGGIGVGLNYDPQRAAGGLQGSYYNNCNGSTTPFPPPVPAVTRIDPVVGFYWGNDGVYGTPAYGVVVPGNYCAQWTGFLTVPYSGVWQIGALGIGDGIAIQLGSTSVLNDWTDHSAANEFCTGVTASACNQTLQGGVGYPITINYYHHLSVAQIELGAKGPINADGSPAPGQLNQVAVPAPWLTPPNRSLPAGWRLSIPTGGARFNSAPTTAVGVTLNMATGAGVTYNWNGSTYQPPEGETAALKWVTEGSASVLKVADGAVTYTFDTGGKLLSTVSGADLSTPTSPTYTFDPASGHVTAITDPVSGRHLDVTYGSRSGGSDPNCHVSAAGFDPDPPIGMICKIGYPDGSADRLHYTSGQFSRLVTSIPAGSTNAFGGNITDMGYDAQSRLVSTRTPLASDQVAAGMAAADTTSATVAAYDPATGKVTSLTAPKAQASATTQITHSYTYTSPTETRMHVAGYTEPPGAPWARKVTFDSNGRITADTDPAGLTTTTGYDTLDDPIVVTTPAGMRTTTFYDPEGRPTDTYGPAATALFDSTDHPAAGNTNRVPHAVVGHDQGMHGLAVEYYNTTGLSGTPVARGLAIGKGGNDFYNSYPTRPAPGVSATNWSARYTGRITWPATGVYTLNLASAGGARLYVDGILIDDAWSAHSASWTNAPFGLSETSGTTSRIEIDYYNTTYNPGLVQLGWSGAQSGDIATSALSPDLGLVTSTADADGHKTATEYARPELGTVSATVVDPAGLALRTTEAYDSLLRPTGRRLPANSYPQAVRADTPAGYWRLDDHTYETLGDASGHNLTGSYSGPGVTVNQPSALAADADASAAFDGVTGTATIADNASLRFERTQAFSVEAWVNTTSTATVAVASKMANAAPNQGWEIGLNGGKPYLQLTNTASTNTIQRSGSINLADGRWHQLVVTYDGSSHAAGVNIYQDGTVDPAPLTVSDNLTATTISTAALTVGSRAASSEWFPGGIDDIAVYPAAIPAGRVAIHANAGRTATAAVTTTYYTSTSGPSNTCAGVGIVGLAAQTTDADPDGTGPSQPIVHQAVYDPLGRTTGREILGDANWSCVGYDTRSRPATGTDSAGHPITDNYNDATAPGTVTQTFTDSAGALRTTTAVTDLLGRSTSYTDEQGGITTAGYDDQTGRLTDTYRSIFGGAQTHLTHTGYDVYGQPSTSTEYLSGTARTTTIGYDPQGRPQTTTLPNGVVTTTSYNPDLGYLAGLTNVNAGSVHLSDWSYQQTLGGMINTDTNTGVRTRDYTYDQAGRLTQTVEGSTTRLYAYDPNSNRCALAAACDGSWTYNTADQLAASPQATGYTYNNHGQLIAAARVDGKTETISYDANDHATTIDDGTTTIIETLAPTGRVLERIVTNDTSHAVTEDTLYGYSDSSDNPAYTRPAAGGSVTSYVGACVDVAGTGTWQIRNGHGDAVGTTDAAGNYTANPTTDEFGAGTTPATRLGYLGGSERFTTDIALGIIRMGVRLYDPSLGRFLQVDPIAGGSANAYDYTMQDPVNGFDLGGDISFCSDDFCPAAEARIQADNLESPLNTSYFFLNASQDTRENLAIDNAPIYGKTTLATALIGTVVIFGKGAAWGAVAAAAAGATAEELAVLGGVSLAGSLATAAKTCAQKGVTSRKCAGDALAAGVSFASIAVGSGAGPVAGTAINAVSAGWDDVSEWVFGF